MIASPRLRELGALFFRAGNFAPGGGAPAVAILQRELVHSRRWLPQEDYGLCYALARVTPGTNLLAFYAAVGYRLRGWRGSLVALIAGVLPCCILAGLVTAGFDRVSHNPWIAAGIDGALASSVGVLLASFWLLVRPYLKAGNRVRSVLIVAASLALSLYAGLSPITVLLLAALSGLIA